MPIAHRIVFYESLPLTLAVCLGAMVAGMVAGSIIHGVAWRITHGRTAFDGGPSCRACGQGFTLRESIPVISWLSMKGICPYCGEPLGMDKPLCELLGGGIFVSVALRYAISLQTLEVLAVACVLMTIALSSLWDYHIPNGCIACAVAIRLLYLATSSMMGEDMLPLAIASVVGAVALSVPFALAVFLSSAMLARDITGMGTVKLVAIVGLYLGWQQGLIAMACATALLLLVWILSPTKLLNVEVAGGAHRNGEDDDYMPSPREMTATLEEDICEPIRLIPFTPAIVLALWGVMLVGVTPSVWNAPIF